MEPALGCAGKMLVLGGPGLSPGRWLCRPRVPVPPSPSQPPRSYLACGEVLSRAASLRSRASTAPPSRCRRTSCGSLSTLRISSWCRPMHAAASCQGTDTGLSWGLGTSRSGGLCREGRGMGTAPRYLRPRQAVGAPQLLDAALQQLRRPPEAGREGMQLLRGEAPG